VTAIFVLMAYFSYTISEWVLYALCYPNLGLRMLEIESLFKSSFQNRVFSGDYNFSDGTHGVPDNDSNIAIIREFLQGNISDVRLSAHNANPATSMTRMFVEAAVDIRDKLILMEQVAQKAADGYYTSTDKASMQKKFEQLAKEINDIVNNTEYENNRLFTSTGRVISRPLGNGRTINLFSRDLTLDITNLNLTRNAKAALAIIKNELKEANEYSEYLLSQNKLLQDAMATIENRIASAAVIEPGDFEMKIAQNITSYLATRIREEPFISSQSQSNITADETLYLLKDD